MPTIAQLAAAARQHIAYLLVVEGWPVMFTDNAALAGSGASSWIDTDYGQRRVVAGLYVPDSLKCTLDYDATGDSRGLLREEIASFQIEDLDEELIALFQEPDGGDFLGERLSPADDPAPATLNNPGHSPIDIRERWVGAEYIEQDGSRRGFGCIPGINLPGDDHPAVLSDEEGQHLVPVPVREDPPWYEGQRVALYILRRDPHGNQPLEHLNWEKWQNQYNSGRSLVWWGRLRRGTVEGRRWRLPCSGQASWLRKPLHQNAWPEPVKVGGNLHFSGPDSNKIAIRLGRADINGVEYPAQHAWHDDASNVIPDNLYPEELADWLENRISILRSAAPAIGEDSWSDDVNGGPCNARVEHNGEGCKIGVTLNNSNSYGATMKLWMSEEVWCYLGFSPTVQSVGRKTIKSNEYLIEFKREEFKPGDGGPLSPPQYSGFFSTAPVGTSEIKEVFNEQSSDSPIGPDNDNNYRYYLGLNNAAFLFYNQPQPPSYHLGQQPPWMESTLARPPAQLDVAGEQADATRLMLFRGKRNVVAGVNKDGDPDFEATDYGLVGKVCWKTNGGAMKIDSNAKAAFRIERWFAPPLCGMPWKTPQAGAPWAANYYGEDPELRVTATPLAFFGYRNNEPDRMPDVLVRLLVGSGTAYWGGYDGQEMLLTAGDNAVPQDVAHLMATDAEIWDLSLQVPADLVDVDSIFAAAAEVPGGVDSPLNLGKWMWASSVQSEDVLRALLQPRDLAFSLRGWKYGLFSLSAPLTFEDVDVTLTETDLDGDGDGLFIPPAHVRPTAPIDAVVIKYGQAPDEDDGPLEHRVISKDAQRPTRMGNQEIELDGRGLVPIEHFQKSGYPTPVADWRPYFEALWGSRVAKWCARPHVLVTLRVRPPKSFDVQVGAVVLLTHPWLPTAIGVYGVTTTLGRLLSHELDTKSLVATVQVLLDPKSPAHTRRFAPAAVVLDDVADEEDRLDTTSRVFSCYQDYWGRGDAGNPDVKHFVEPEYSGVGGGLALCEVWQTDDGVDWTKTCTFLAESVDTAASTITYQAGSLTGTFRKRSPALIILAPWSLQTSAWVKALFLPTTREDGTIDGVTPGYRFEDK